MSYKIIDKAYLDIGEKWCNCFLVTYPTSIRYNGGMSEDGEWYEGYKVAKPKVPEGFKLVGIGCGLQLNSHPPYATAYLEPLDGRKVSRKELKSILSNMRDKSDITCMIQASDEWPANQAGGGLNECTDEGQASKSTT
jgi:hypothetical protein